MGSTTTDIVRGLVATIARICDDPAAALCHDLVAMRLNKNRCDLVAGRRDLVASDLRPATTLY